MTAQPFVSYAQNHEDVVLARALLPERCSGTWIDVGAADPVLDSVTNAFAERGWRGVNIEPLPAEFTKLERARPNDTNLRVAIGATPGTAKLFEGPPENRGSSTMVAAIADRYRDEGQEFHALEVPVRTLAQIVDEHVDGPVDFLKVDVEGYEREVLAGADWTRLRPRVVVVEATVPNSREPAHDEWEGILLSAGYCCALFDGLNRFYAREDEPDLLLALAAPANVLDDYVPFVWAHAQEEVTTWARSLEAELGRATEELDRLAEDSMVAWSTVREAKDRTRAGHEQLLGLREELAAAQLRTARALAAARDADLAASRPDPAAQELAALQATRTFRSTAKLRHAYGVLRRILHT